MDNFQKDGDNTTFKERGIKVLKLVIPAVFGNIMTMVMETINLVFVGHMNDSRMIAAIGLGNTMINMSFISIICGMNGALNTLVS